MFDFFPPCLLYFFILLYFYLSFRWSTPLKKRTPTAKNAANTQNTKSLNTKPVKRPILLKENDGTIENNKGLVDKPNQFFTKKQKPQRKLHCDWSARSAKPRVTSASNVANRFNWVPRKPLLVILIR